MKLNLKKRIEPSFARHIIGLVLLGAGVTIAFLTTSNVPLREQPPMSIAYGPTEEGYFRQRSYPYDKRPLTLDTARLFSLEPEELNGRVLDDRVSSVKVEVDTKFVDAAISRLGGEVKWRALRTAFLFTFGENHLRLRSMLKDGSERVQDFTITVQPTPEIVEIPATLRIDWQEIPVRVSIAIVVGASEYESTVKGAGPMFSESEAFKLGTVRGGIYDGYPLYMIGLEYCELGCYTRWYRVLKDPKTEKVLYLSMHSSELDPSDMILVDFQLTNVSIPDLNIPDEFILNGTRMYASKKEFFFSGRGRESWFFDQELTIVSHHPQYGVVYTDAPVSDLFYLRTPDNRVVPYRFDIPFMRDNRIPEISWSDETSNAVDYRYVDIGGGCAAESNTFAVRPENLVRPADRLVQIGTTKNGEPVFGLKDSQDPELKDLYDTYSSFLGVAGPNNGVKSYDDFLALRPLFYWKDPFDRWIRFVRFDFQPAAECGKPVIYLYPEKETEARVFVGLRGRMTVSEPEHGKRGWDVMARPDGYVVNRADGKLYPNLYWEGYGVNYKTPSQGFVIRSADGDSWLRKTLSEIGFTTRESAEFREFWVPRLPKTPYLFITFVPQFYFDRDAPLRITPKPDAVYRIFMEYRGLEEPVLVKPLQLPHIVRKKFTVVEWGGALK